MSAATKERKPTAGYKVDWAQAFAWFCQDTSRTYPDVAKRFKVALNTVKRRASAEQWLKRRQSVAEKRQEIVNERVAIDAADRNRSHIDQYRHLQGFLGSVMKREERLFNEGVPPDLGDLRALAAAIKQAADGERVALGLPTSHEKRDNNLNINDPWREVADDELDTFVGQVQQSITRRLHEREQRKNGAGAGSTSSQGKGVPARG